MPVRSSPINVQTYELLFVIETVLRELIIEQMAALDGPKWYKTRLPGEALGHFHLGIASDRATKWTRNIPHHPVYYLGFPDLRLTIEQRDNWTDVFKAIFPKTKELVTTDLIELEFIRNKVAHCRRASDQDLRIVEAAYSKLSSTLSPKRTDGLAGRYTVATDIPTALNALAREADVSYALVAAGRRLRYLPQWHKAEASYWWLDESYLGSSITSIETLFAGLATALNSESSALVHEQLKMEYQTAKQQLSRIVASWLPMAV